VGREAHTGRKVPTLMETLMIFLSEMNTPVGAEYLVVLGWEQKVRAVTKWVEGVVPRVLAVTPMQW